jgi:hypothetical protein
MQKKVDGSGASVSNSLNNSNSDISYDLTKQLALDQKATSINALIRLEAFELAYKERNKEYSDISLMSNVRRYFKDFQQYCINGIDLDEFDFFCSFKAAYLNMHWKLIQNSVSGENEVYFESFISCYLDESQFDIDDRKFLLLKHFFPNMSLEQIFALKVWTLPIELTIKRAVCETKPLLLKPERPPSSR